MLGGKPKFAALAALDQRQLDWVALPQKPFAEVHNYPNLKNMVDLKKYSLVAQSYHMDGPTYGALLWHRGPETAKITFDNSDNIVTQTKLFSGTGSAVRQIRPHVSDSVQRPIIWAWHGDRKPGLEGVHKAVATEEDMKELLGDWRKRGGMRPGCIAAVNRDGKVSFAATLYTDPTVADFDYDLALKSEELPKRTSDLATAGFYPAALTAYEWEGATRYCVVWLKDKPKK